MSRASEAHPFITIRIVILCALGLTVAKGTPLVLSDDGGWCWYQDERAVIVADKLVVGAVAMGTHDAERKGDAEVLVFDLRERSVERLLLYDQLGADDHNVPAFVPLPDGRLLAIFATHGRANSFWTRASAPHNPLRWGEPRKIVPSEKSRITYSNPFRLRGENNRLYNFYRGYDNSFKPSYTWSDDFGRTWNNGGVFIEVPARERHRPYVKYCSDGEATIHMLYTEGHPRNYDNSIYHVLYRDGRLHTSQGEVIATLADGLARPEDGTRVFQGGVTQVAWTQDLHLSGDGRPVAVFSVQRDPKTLPPGHPESGQDHRYHYARWDGAAWRQHEIAHAGTRLYPREDDYTGLIVIDPDDVSTVYLSTDADPATGNPLISTADGQRHYEIYRGVTKDGGKSFHWTAITKDSTADNIRPLVPKWDRSHTALLWLRGKMTSFTDYDLEVVGIIDPLREAKPAQPGSP